MRFRSLIALQAAAALAAACGASQKSAERPAAEARIAELEERVEALERTLDALETRGHVASELASRVREHESRISAMEDRRRRAAPGRAPSRPRPPTPDPNDVYAVPIGSSPCVGAKHARVTMIQAFEFA